MITLKTLPEATAQQVFDQVAKHLLKQKSRSLSRDGFCVYRSDDGMMCAAGCLIGPKEYRKTFEGYNWQELVDREQVCSTHKTLIRELQVIHDNRPTAVWVDNLKTLAKEWGLNVNALTKKKKKEK